MFTEFFKNITYDSSIPIITQEDVKFIIQKSLGTKLHQNAIIVLADAKYTTISEYKISEIYMDSGLRNFQYREEVNDCDDASLLFKSALVKSAGNDWKVKYPYAAGIVFGNIPTPHAINWFITPEMRLKFIEPQSGEIFNPKGDRIFFIFS